MPTKPLRHAPRRRQRCASNLLAALVVVSGGCSGGGTGAPIGNDRVAEAVIGPEGGVLGFADGTDPGVALEVPPGAVALPTRFSITADVHSPQVLSAFPIYRFAPSSLQLAAPVTVTVPVSATAFHEPEEDGHPYELDGEVACFLQVSTTAAWVPLLDTSVDGFARTASATTTRLGDVVAWSGILHRLMTQDFRLLDPAEVVASEIVTGTPVLVENGSYAVQVGRGSLASFWSSPASDNVLILPGLFGSPLDYLGDEDLIVRLPPTVKNIVLLAYPSGRGVAATANALFDEIAARRQTGFGCAIIGHSMGGLIGRYLIERSADDATRPGWHAGQDSLSDTVTNLVLIGTPNGGSAFGDELVAFVERNAEPNEAYLMQGALDISRFPEAIALQLTAAYVDNPTAYHILYGDRGDGTDGVVTTSSATALALIAPETSALFAAQHDALHSHAASNGVAAYVHMLLGAGN